jgi:hypothetical protein
MALKRERFAASVIALPDHAGPDHLGPVGVGPAGIEFVSRARRWQPGLKALVVGETTAMRFVEQDCETLLTRPFDPRQLLGCVFELVLREGDPGAAPHPSYAAELGINAARLACLCHRHAAAAAAGACRLGQDLTRQIGETRGLHRGLAAALGAAGRIADAPCSRTRQPRRRAARFDFISIPASISSRFPLRFHFDPRFNFISIPASISFRSTRERCRRHVAGTAWQGSSGRAVRGHS